MTDLQLTEHNSHLAAKKRTSAVGNCVLITITALATRGPDSGWLEWTLWSCIVVASVLRWLISIPAGVTRARRWFMTYAGLTLVTGTSWGLLAALIIADRGAGHHAALFMMIINAGISAAGSNSLTPNRRLAGAFALAVLVPMGLALGLTAGWTYLPVIALLITYQFFLMMQVGVNSNVLTQLREREEQYQILIEASHEGIIIHDGGEILETNPGFTRMLGYTSAELIGTSILELLHPDERDGHLAEMRAGSEAARTGRVLHKDGSVHAIEIRGRNLNYLGRAARVICVQDMTSHFEAERARRSSVEEGYHLTTERERAAVEALRVRSDFLANMSHEIRTPLNAIIGLTDLLDETADDETRRRYVRTLKTSGEGLLTLVNDILDFSKIDAGQLDFEYSAVGLIGLVEDQCDLLASRAVAKGLALSTFVDPRLPALVRGDAGRLGQVVLNLVSNAIKFTEAGGIHVRAVGIGREGSVERVRFEVQDSGIGVPSELAHRIFRPFSQADSSMSRKFGGIGLGLSICKRLIEGMDGTMSFDSIEGRGTTFWFEVPLTVLSERAPDFIVPNIQLTLIDSSSPASEAIKAYALAWSIPWREADPDARPVAGNEIMVGTAATLSRERMAALGAHGYLAIDPAIRHRVSTAIIDPRLRTLPTPVRQMDLLDALKDLARPQAGPAPLPPVAASAPQTFEPAHLLVVEDNSTNQMLILAVLAQQIRFYHARPCGQRRRGGQPRSRRKTYDLILMDLSDARDGRPRGDPSHPRARGRHHAPRAHRRADRQRLDRRPRTLRPERHGRVRAEAGSSRQIDRRAQTVLEVEGGPR